jgi:hypothetical protein
MRPGRLGRDKLTGATWPGAVLADYDLGDREGGVGGEV